MENVTEALMMAFAVLVFVAALSLCLVTFSEARETSEIILYSSDDTNYYEYIDGEEQDTSRIVGMETIIPTLYRYYKENYTVIFSKNCDDSNCTGCEECEFDLYNTTDETWILEHKGDATIGRFDLAEESKRGEMWTAIPNQDCKLHIDAFLYGKEFKNPNNDGTSMNYTNNGFLEEYKDEKFIETLGEYEYERASDGSVGETSTTIIVDGEIINLKKKDTKRVITYTLYKE